MTQASNLATPLLDESEVVEALVEQFANGRQFPGFMVPGGKPLPIGNDLGFIHRHRQFVADLAIVAAGGPAKALADVRKRAAEGADQVPVKLVPRTEEGRRRRRARFIEAPTLALALDYVLDLVARREYARRLTRCKFCGRFFFQAPGKRRPYRYCPGTDHREQAHDRDGAKRAANTRERRKAARILARDHDVPRAAVLVRGMKSLKADEMVRRALAARKHK